MMMVTCNSFLLFLALFNHGVDGAMSIRVTRNMMSKFEGLSNFEMMIPSDEKDTDLIKHRELTTNVAFRDYALQTVSGLHSIKDTTNWKFLAGDFDRNGNKPDVYTIKMQGVNSTEVHVLDGNSNYKTFSLQTSTPLHKTTGDAWDFGLADFNKDGKLDLYAIKRQGVSSTEIHILDGASHFQKFLLQTKTPLCKTGAEWRFLVGDYNCDGYADIYAINRYGKATTEVSILNGKDKFSTFLLQNQSSGLHKTTMDFGFSLGDYNADGKPDIYIIKRQGASKSTELHALNGASCFANFLLHSPTALPPTATSTWSFLVADFNGDCKPDLFGFNMKNGAPGQCTDVKILKA